jgi:magnesium-transporting ATPase (P-type)
MSRGQRPDTFVSMPDAPQARRSPTRGFDPEEPLDNILFEHLKAERRGLAAREAARRLAQHGPNEITRRERPSSLRELGRQLTHPLALLLWAAAALAVVGRLVALAVAIVVVILFNALFAFLQERQAERATEALRELLPPRVQVRRGGRELEIEATQLVPGDLLLLHGGDRISADARLVDGSVEVDMSALTGESLPVARSAVGVRAPTPRLESPDLVFAGTLCLGGEAEAVVYATGMATELGRIAALTQRVRPEPSPLQLQIARLARLIAAIAVAAGGAFLAIGSLVAGLPTGDALVFAIGLLVANVPEGLLPTLTLALGVGVRRMARRRALLKRLTAVETLGATDVICTDKTGTLTEGRMTVRYLWTPAGELELPPDGARPAPAGPGFGGLLRTAVRCNNAGLDAGDPSERALLVAAARLGEDVATAQDERVERRRRLFHFDSRLKRMTTVDAEPDGSIWAHARAHRTSCSTVVTRCARSTPRARRSTGRSTRCWLGRCRWHSRATRSAGSASSGSRSASSLSLRRPARSVTRSSGDSRSSGSRRSKTRCELRCRTPCDAARAPASGSSSSRGTTASPRWPSRARRGSWAASRWC